MKSSKRFVLDARTATDHFPGIGRYVSNLARAMPTLLTSDEELIILRDPRTTEALPPVSGNVSLVDCVESPFSLTQQWRVPRLLHRHRPSVYHSPYYLMPYWSNIPTVVTLFDLTPMLVPKAVPFVSYLAFRVGSRLALRRAAHILVSSESTRQDLIMYFSTRTPPVEVTPLASDQIFVPQSEESIGRLKDKYRLPEKYVLYVGVNKPHKNLVRLVEAWGLVNQRVPEAVLVLAGAWDERFPETKVRVEMGGLTENVRFLGRVPDSDLPSLYSGATVFVFPSLREGFGLPVLEAMSSATAVTCSNLGGLPEVAGQAALYFNPTDLNEMAQQIVCLLTDDHRREICRTEGIEQANRFSWQATAQMTLDVYRQVESRT